MEGYDFGKWAHALSSLAASAASLCLAIPFYFVLSAVFFSAQDDVQSHHQLLRRPQPRVLADRHRQHSTNHRFGGALDASVRDSIDNNETIYSNTRNGNAA